MLRLTLLLLPVLITTSVAQTTAQTYTPVDVAPASALDSSRAVEDSILAAASALVARDSSAVDELEKIATIHKQRKRFAMQLQVASAMSRANPGSALAHLVYGDALLDNDQPEGAMQQLQKALAIQPNYVRARVMLAETLEILRMPDSALAHLDTALQHNPRHAQAHMQRAKLLMRHGRTSEAVAHYRTACELLPDAPSSYSPWMKYADALIANYSYADALEALRYCMRLQPTFPDAYLRYAEALERAERRDDAIRAYNDFALRFPTDDRALDAERAALRLRYPQR